MSSRARLRAFFDSVLAFTSGLRRSTALSRGMSLPPAGPAQESATGFGLMPGDIPFQAREFHLVIVGQTEHSDADRQLPEGRTSVL
jgi:hypothetical protein